ncbi:ACP S-malonyltransferase [Salinarimonas sp.]|uniref:ACP S-malonyltransferase n=1 Tax=Salinarimonas sp. TaxID=2766526 RepID=UPI0032D988CF
MTLAMLCPGQGSQAVGMGRALLSHHPVFDEMLADAGARMSVDLGRVVRKGPARLLQSTRVAQVAIFVFSAGIGRILHAAGVRFRMAAGHSLGEISALHLAGAIRFDDALDLVIARAAAMEHANALSPGGMAAVSGAWTEECGEICATAGITVCNFNAPTQTVISGDVAALAQAEAALRAAGLRVTRLDVAGAYHSPLMAPAVPMFEEALARCPMHEPRIPVLSNVTGAVIGSEDDLRRELLTQVTAPVLWKTCLSTMAAQGASAFVEVGIGKQMRGLALQNMPGATCLGTASPGEIAAVVAVAAAEAAA